LLTVGRRLVDDLRSSEARPLLLVTLGMRLARIGSPSPPTNGRSAPYMYVSINARRAVVVVERGRRIRDVKMILSATYAIRHSRARRMCAQSAARQVFIRGVALVLELHRLVCAGRHRRPCGMVHRAQRRPLSGGQQLPRSSLKKAPARRQVAAGKLSSPPAAAALPHRGRRRPSASWPEQPAGRPHVRRLARDSQRRSSTTCLIGHVRCCLQLTTAGLDYVVDVSAEYDHFSIRKNSFFGNQ
jgi:hypothetical protein